MNNDGPLRRATLAIVAVGVAAWILRPQLAQALIVRGDEQLYGGHASEALRYYARAARLNPRDGVAVDRLTFVALTLRNNAAIDDGIRLATLYLESTDDRAVRLDRAMAYRVRGRLPDALKDFAAVGLSDGDVTALTFAGSIALRLGHRADAVGFWKRAIVLAPDWLPARRALQRLAVHP